MEMSASITLLILSLVTCSSAQTRAPVSEPRQYSGLRSVKRTLMLNYARRDPPLKDRPTQVRLGLYILNFNGVNEQTMDYSLTMYLRQSWRDARLAFDPVDGITEYDIEELLDEVWLPDTFIRNEKDANYHDITVANKILKLNATGHIFYVSKITATMSSPMKLQKYPFDTQRMPIYLESFKHTMDTLYFGWLEKPVEVDKPVMLSQYTLRDIILFDCSQNYTSGAFPCLELDFILRRDLGHFLLHVYLPSLFLVILSWASFWLSHVSHVTARVLLGLIPIMLLAMISLCFNSSLPQLSYMKTLDYWTGGCFLFLLASLVELVVVVVMASKQQKAQVEKGVEAGGASTCSARAEMVDKVSRVAFPAVYLLFNVIFWISVRVSATGIY